MPCALWCHIQIVLYTNSYIAATVMGQRGLSSGGPKRGWIKKGYIFRSEGHLVYSAINLYYNDGLTELNLVLDKTSTNQALQWRHNGGDGVSNHRCVGVCSTVCSSAYQRKHQRSASLAYVRGIHRWSVNSPHKGPVTWKMFPFDDVIINSLWYFLNFKEKIKKSFIKIRQSRELVQVSKYIKQIYKNIMYISMM